MKITCAETKSCAQCGRVICKGDTCYSKGELVFLSGMDVYCSQGCANAAKGKSGGGIASAAGGMFKSNPEEDAANRARAEAAQAKHKECIQTVKDFQFSQDDEGFIRDINNFADDYKSCNDAFFADRDYKAAYKKRFETEMKVLKDSNPQRYEKMKEAYEEARNSIAKRLKIRLCVCGGITLALMITFFIKFEDARMNGILYGLLVGGVLTLFGNVGMFRKSDKE